MSSSDFTRRRWVQGFSLAISAATLNGTLEAQEYRIAGADLKLGVASYSFRNFSREQAIQMTKQLGTPYLNIKDVHLPLNSTPEEIAAAKKEFADAGIILVGCGNVSFQKDDEADIRSKFEYAKLAGFPLIVCAPTATTLPKLEKFVKEYNIKIAVHNHGPEDKNFPTPQSVLKMVKDMDPRCGLCIDIGHTARTGVDLVASIAEAGPRLLDMHAKDLANTHEKETQVAVGEGKLPIPQIFLQLIKMKYQGCVNLEYEIHPDDPLPGMQKSFSYMRGVLAGIEAAKYPS
jgi:sugar phosphate isomerase/epimerase